MSSLLNIADSSICIGVALLILFYSKDASIAFRVISEKNHSNSATK